MELDTLDAVEVHGDGGDVAGEQRMAAIGRNADGFADVGAAEVERVEPALAIDDVAAVTRVPDEHVIAVAEGRRRYRGPAARGRRSPPPKSSRWRKSR